MITEGFWTSWLAFWVVGGGPCLLAVVSIVYSLYLSRRHLGAFKKALKNSRYICIWGDSLGRRGWIWSLFEMAKIAGMIMMPKAYIRLGDLDPVDFKNFPPHLRRLLKIETVMMHGSIIWMVIAAVLVKFFK